MTNAVIVKAQNDEELLSYSVDSNNLGTRIFMHELHTTCDISTFMTKFMHENHLQVESWCRLLPQPTKLIFDCGEVHTYVCNVARCAATTKKILI